MQNLEVFKDMFLCSSLVNQAYNSLISAKPDLSLSQTVCVQYFGETAPKLFCCRFKKNNFSSFVPLCHH